MPFTSWSFPISIYTSRMASARDLSDWIPVWMRSGTANTACLHYFTDSAGGLKAGTPFEVLTVSSRDSTGYLILREIRLAALGTNSIGVDVEKAGVLSDSKTAWSEAILIKDYKTVELDPKALTDYISTAVLRKVLTGHVISLHYSKMLINRYINLISGTKVDEKQSPSFTQKDESVTRATARIYKELLAWGESRAAAVIAEAEGVATSTIHNRLQLARAGKYLDTPGKGARK